MSRLIAISATLTILFSQAVFGQSGFDLSYNWPMKLQKRFSSGFGDTRPGRFHMGIDLRTNGKEGEKVYAPEDGYVWRLKSSYSGYGKALYVKGVSGRIYVFGHLLRYNWDIGTYLRDRQIENKRYYQDFHLEENILPVKKGQFIARTGQTGAGAPHLHFEIRDEKGRPTNPLYYNIKINDKNRPNFQAVWFSALDDSSLYLGGGREIKAVPVYNKKTGRYEITDTVSVSGRFAVKAAIEDIIGKGSFSLGPSFVRLLIDGILMHEIDYDRIDYAENIYSILDRDFDPDKKDYKRVYNLYRKPGNRFSNYKSESGNDGSFSDTVAGFHDVLIEASDASGNKSRLEFTFLYCPSSQILAPLNKADFADSSITFIYNGKHCRDLFDSVAVVLSDGESVSDDMPVVLSPEIEIGENALTIFGNFNQTTDYRLHFYKDGKPCRINYFSTEFIAPSGQRAVDSVHVSVMDNGILFTAKAYSPGINWLQAEIITDIGSRRMFYRKTGSRQFSLFYHPENDIGVIESIITRGPVGFRPDTVVFQVHPVESGTVSTVTLKDGCHLLLEENILFGDELISIKDTIMPSPETGEFIHGPFILGPETRSFSDWADLQVDIPGSIEITEKIGLYVFHEKKGWLWAGGEYDPVSRLLHCPLGGAGVLAVISDTAAPVITNLNIREGAVIKSSRPPITFLLIDELSGVENDLNFNVSIDGKWIVPEYDPERKSFIAKPHWSLSGGSHNLQIEVRDRCGNVVITKRKFMVGAETGP